MFNRLPKRKLLGVFLGNLFEHYDTALYALLSPFLAPLFFPHYDPVTALMMTYAIIPLGMVARPLGALFFGFLGDIYGRLFALHGTLLGMGGVTIAIAFLPSYAEIGFYAPLLLLLGRICQNFFAAGEVVGGAVYVLEEGDEKSQDLISSLFSASTIAGMLLASAMVSLLLYLGILEEHWRVLYLFGALTGLCALFLRRSGHIVPSKKGMRDLLKPHIKSLRAERKAAFQIMVVAGFSYSCYSVALVVVNGLIPLITHIEPTHLMFLNTGMLLLDFLLLPLVGLLSLYVCRKKIMLASALLALVAGGPLFHSLEGAGESIILFVRLCFIVIGVGFSATFFSWAQTLVPSHCRYTVISLSYALGAQLLGAPTAPFTLAIYKATGSTFLAASYWCLLAIGAAFVMVWSIRSYPIDSRQRILVTDR